MMYENPNPFSPPGYGPSGHSRESYQLNELDRGIIRELASHAYFVGVCWIVLGVIGTFGSVVVLFTEGAQGAFSIFACMALLVQGVFLLGARERIEAIGRMMGGDIPHLVDGLARLQRHYLVMVMAAVFQELISVITIANLVTRS